jgi:ATP-GRASP peptide maturase of grasp-with-spasm system
MILILSEEQDQSTNNVIDWLIYYKKDFFRINYEDFVTKIYLDKNNITLYFEDKIFDFNKITSFWQRKGLINYVKLRNLGNLNNVQKQHLINEWKIIDDYINFKLSKKKGIFNPKENINKLIVLNVAQEAGLLTPNFFISDEKREIFNNTITKPIGESFDLYNNNFIHSLYTEDLESIKYNNFFATLFQEKITPIYEIRSIFLLNQCWSMAIHNPNNEADYRKNYDNLRYSPYKLPLKIQNKIFKLMKILNLRYGAVDFVVDKDFNHYFLEINPFGQFGMVSEPCNYQIEKYIAKVL